MRTPDRLLGQSARALRSLPAWMVDVLNRRPVSNARGVRLDPHLDHHLQLLTSLEERLVGLAQKSTASQPAAPVNQPDKSVWMIGAPLLAG